mmetsp:Transcript_4450/g.11885  ORF Transcript_4450/g.11885 Transcript_4450/m.11885 type:complete len:202 (-) Transcript_4450:101-706(-)
MARRHLAAKDAAARSQARTPATTAAASRPGKLFQMLPVTAVMTDTGGKTTTARQGATSLAVRSRAAIVTRLPRPRPMARWPTHQPPTPTTDQRGPRRMPLATTTTPTLGMPQPRHRRPRRRRPLRAPTWRRRPLATPTAGRRQTIATRTTLGTSRIEDNEQVVPGFASSRWRAVRADGFCACARRGARPIAAAHWGLRLPG